MEAPSKLHQNEWMQPDKNQASNRQLVIGGFEKRNFSPQINAIVLIPNTSDKQKEPYVFLIKRFKEYKNHT